MRRLNLPLILDTILLGLCAFLLFFTAVRYYTESATLALFFGISASLVCGALGFLHISRKQNAKLLISRDERHKKLLALHLSLSSDGYVKRLLKGLLGDEAKINGSRIVCDGKTFFYDFRMRALSEDDIAKIIKRGGEHKILYCTAISPEAAVLADNFLIEVRTIDRLFSELKDKDMLPEKYVFEGAPKASVLQKVKSRFKRKLCAPLFWSGTALLALSYFSFFPVYYIVSGSIMIILAAAALIVNQR